MHASINRGASCPDGRPLPRLLTIDDDPGLHALIRATLGDDYEFTQSIDGPAGLALATRQPPDLILLDITLPGSSGYEICRALRAAEATREVPIIFLSALSELDERLNAYEAGGDDFLGKPFDPVELADKVELSLQRVAERQRLVSDKEAAFATAMTALLCNGEIGVVLGFLRQSFVCPSYTVLADSIIESVASWGLSASVQLRGSSGILARNRHGNVTPLENGVLATLADCGRLTSFGHRLAVNYPHVTLMVVDMPVDDPERNGRLCDDLAWLAEAAEARMQALDNELALRGQQQALERLLQRTGSALAEIENRRRIQKAEAVVHIQDLWATIARQVVTLGFSDEQEQALYEVLNKAVDKLVDIFDRGLETDNHMREIAADLNGGDTRYLM